MKVILHDLDPQYDEMINSRCDLVLAADGKYAPCQGCFGCWTKRPAQCYMKDTLQYVSRTVGKADELIIITQNCYGCYSPAIKAILDRSNGGATPLSTYRGGQMHHALRYGMLDNIKVYVYGDITPEENETFAYLLERNALNYGYRNYSVTVLESPAELEGIAL